MIHCIYASVATAPLATGELGQLLAAARAKNRRLGITGMLLYVDGCFFQVLEGPLAAVDGLYEQIRVDPRHAGVTQIVRESVAARAFDRWTMGYAAATGEELGEIDGLNDFLLRPRGLADLDGSRALKLLNAFHQGRWRVRLEAGADA
ncbi:MAG: BLUF domain-containing protein [Burkholderiales bacterium]|nr:BLUF domain-containing protein [Burkholderiales bacterium]